MHDLCFDDLQPGPVLERREEATMIGKRLEQPRGRFALTNGRVILPDSIVTDKAVIIERDNILDVIDGDALGGGLQEIDTGWIIQLR